MGAYIGITGLSCTGKDTIADMLAGITCTRGVRVFRYRLSDEILQELARRGIPAESISRALLIETGNEMRAKWGVEFWRGES